MKVLLILLITIFGFNFNSTQSAAAAAASPATNVVPALIKEQIIKWKSRREIWLTDIKKLYESYEKGVPDHSKKLFDGSLKDALEAGLTYEYIHRFCILTKNDIIQTMILIYFPSDEFSKISITLRLAHGKWYYSELIDCLYSFYDSLPANIKKSIQDRALAMLLQKETQLLKDKMEKEKEPIGESGNAYSIKITNEPRVILHDSDIAPSGHIHPEMLPKRGDEKESGRETGLTAVLG